MIPTIPGVPSWGAVLIAVTFTAIGFAFDAGSGGKELTLVFAGAYAVGCIAAVVAVRQTGHLHRGHSATADPVRHACPAPTSSFTAARWTASRIC